VLVVSFPAMLGNREQGVGEIHQNA
jgi:hypothetical protein